MKKILIGALVLFSLNANKAFAEEPSAEALLHQMREASQTLNYELSYVQIQKSSIEPLIYRHATHQETNLAHLVYLSGPVREVIRRDNQVSYIEPGDEPYTIQSNKMVAPTIPLLRSNIAQLSEQYDFVRVGRGREAGIPSQVVRVVPKDGLRYSYVLWIDEQSKLPLRADLLDRDGELLEQYRTVSLRVDDRLAQHMAGLITVRLPEVMTLPKPEVKDKAWQVTWTPEGFSARDSSQYRLAVSEKSVETQMFTDGLFNFSVYVAAKDQHSVKGQSVRQGRKTLHSYVNGQREISVVGDIPPETAERIAKSVKLQVVKTQ